MLITFEGIDGSGKSTQIEHLGRALKSASLPVSIFREPGGTPVSEKIRELLLHSATEIDPVTEILLFSAARSQLVAGRIMNLLKQGEIVLLDRFYDSTTAYQGFGRNSLQLNDIRHLNRIAAHNIVPDLTFYLRIGYEEAELRLGERVKDRMEGSGKEFYLKTILGFDEISEREERIVVLDATRPADEIHRAVVEKVREFGISV